MLCKGGGMPIYGVEQRALQERFDTSNLAAAFEATIFNETIDDENRTFIESRDFFFLSTVDGDGWPTVSYKGGPVGLVRVVDERTVEFPSYDGSGMYLSMGNIDASAKIGMLFIDMETPRRLRVQATAQLIDDDETLAHWPGSQLVVRATVAQTFPNCARYIHQHERRATSQYVPDNDGAQPMPAWKRIDMIQPFLPTAQQGLAEDAGGTITGEEYAKRLANGTS
jgi:predicted pyridoxine 5'-phosphate oxidase superfamily flavin-nucleotide-binding protein